MTTDHFKRHLLLSHNLDCVGNNFYFTDDESKRSPKLLEQIKTFKSKTCILNVEYNDRTPYLPQIIKEFSDGVFTDLLIRLRDSVSIEEQRKICSQVIKEESLTFSDVEGVDIDSECSETLKDRSSLDEFGGRGVVASSSEMKEPELLERSDKELDDREVNTAGSERGDNEENSREDSLGLGIEGGGGH